MKRIVVIVLTVFIVGIVLHSCKESVTGPPQILNNLLSNSSFESNGSFSLESWSFSVTPFIDSVQDTPPYGGRWSVKLETVWPPPLSIKTAVAAPEGTHQYRLSSWAKVVGVGGKFSLMLKRLDNDSLRKSISVAANSWTLYSVLDTLTGLTGDSLIVILEGGFSKTLAGQTLFDLCTLEKLN